MNNTWFSLWWTMWNNQCDILKPIYARSVKEWAAENWTPIIDQPCHREIVEYWWDALHKAKISPAAMTTYGRNEANAIFEAGDAAFTVADSTFWGEFNDKNKSLVAGKVGMAKFPYGPRRTALQAPSKLIRRRVRGLKIHGVIQADAAHVDPRIFQPCGLEASRHTSRPLGVGAAGRCGEHEREKYTNDFNCQTLRS